MRFDKLMLIFFIAIVAFSVQAVNAQDIDSNQTDGLSVHVDDAGDVLGENQTSIYVDASKGLDSRDGLSSKNPVKTIGTAISKSKDNGTVYLANGRYYGTSNTKLTVSKSLTFIGSKNTVVDGQNANYLFIIPDNVTVTFRNIKFVNAYKSPSSYSATFNGKVYGAALDIRNAKVLIDNCSFTGSLLHYGTLDKYVYGGAISNFGDLTITGSTFDSNKASSDSGLFSYGGAIYNKANLTINNSRICNSRAVDFGYGAAIANDGNAVMDNCIVSGSNSSQECKGSAIYNTGEFTLLNSIIENNYIGHANFNCIYGAIYNSGTLIACGNVFRNNSADYEAPTPSYKGSPNIYNVGNINLTYNVFSDNLPFDGISQDLYFNGGEIISLDNNWWNCNENPYSINRLNVNKVNSWLQFNLNPDYSKLAIGEAVEVTASWSCSDGMAPQIDLFPLFDVEFSQYGVTKQLTDGKASFLFNHTSKKGLYTITALVGSFNQSVIVDVGKLDSFIRFDVNDNITYMDDLNITVEVVDEDGNPVAGNVSIIINKKTYDSRLSDGKARISISNLNPELYSIRMIYGGSDEYFKAFNDTQITINKQQVGLAVNISEIKIGQTGYAVVTLIPKGVYGQAILYVDGVRKKVVYLYNGDNTIPLKNFAEGEYNISLQFVETNFYKSANASALFRISKYDSSLVASASDIHVGQNGTIVIDVTPSTLRGEAILNINGINNTIFLENSTTYVNLYGLHAGSYNVSVIFEGDDKYYSSSASTSFNVLKTQTILDVDIDMDEKNLNGTITVNISPAECSGQIGLYVNYNHYAANITSGKASFSVKFDKGTNYVFVYYEGSEMYSDASWNTTVGADDEFVFIGENSTGWNCNDFRYSVRLLEVTGIPMPNRIVAIEFDGGKYNITTDANGYAYFKLNLQTGEYDISATYKNATIVNRLAVRDFTYNMTADDIVYGNPEVVSVSFDEAISGNVTFRIDGISNETVEIVNGSAVYSVSGLDVGNYTVRAVYSNARYTGEEISSRFSVKKASLRWNVTADDVVYTMDQVIRVSNLANATGSLTFTVNGAEYTRQIRNSEAVLNLSRLSTGKYSMTVGYGGDRNYNNLTSSHVFYVKEKSSDVILSVADGIYGENMVAVASLNKNATGVVRFSAGNLSGDVEIVDGFANWTFSGIDVGSYRLTAVYLGDHYYITSSNSTAFSISKADSQISISVGDVWLNENIRIYAHLSPNATGKVTFSMIGYYSPRARDISDSTAMWYISPLKTGEYTVVATYAGDKNYNASNTTYQLKVSQKKAVLAVEIDDVGLNDRVTAKITLNSGDGESITDRISLKIADKSYSILVNNGKSLFVIGRMDEGNYTYQATYDGNENYSRSSCEGSFIVRDSLLDVNLTADNFVKYYRGSKEFSISLLSSSGKAIAGETIHITIGGKEYSAITDSSGKASISLDLASGNYTAFVRFNETEKYHAASANVSISILPTVEGIDLFKVYGSGNQYFALFYDSNGKVLGNTNVSFKIGKNSITVATLPNGIARLNINLNRGTYIITATNPVTGEKAINTIKIFTRLAGNKNVVQYYGGNKYYKVRAYNDNGKPVGAGEVVKIKINGKTRNVKTNRNGYALFKITLKPNVYTIKATYKSYTVSNRITVKPVLTTKIAQSKKTKKTIFAAKLVNTKGKVLKAKKITFKIAGKKYVAKTNKKGVASVAIKLKLKKGTYNVYAIYGKIKVLNKIRVK